VPEGAPGHVARLPVGVVVRRPGTGAWPLEVHAVTASAFEARDHPDTAEDTAERLPMGFDSVARHVREVVFVERQRRDADDAGAIAREPARTREDGHVCRAPTAGRRPAR
jgi:hypothetical protein